MDKFFCFDCSKKCKDSHPENSVHIVVEVRGVENTEPNSNFITVVVDKTVQKHNIPCGDITFVAPTSLSKDETRFLLRDKLLDNKITILYCKDLYPNAANNEDIHCDLCYHDTDLEPLEWRGFNL